MLSKFKPFVVLASSAMMAIMLSGCSEYYADEVRAPTDQELNDMYDIKPKGALTKGVFHMQRVASGSSVRMKDDIILKRPDLPPFDVAYINRDLESVILELANAAGESVVIPGGLRGRSVTLVHSGADFKQMLELVLQKAGYHYNYVDGVWVITRYPIRNYVVELGQSTRTGTLIGKAEIVAASDGESTNQSAQALETDYADSVWDQIDSTLTELVKVGLTSGGGGGGTLAVAASPQANVLTTSTQVQEGGLNLLPTPTLGQTEESSAATVSDDDLLATLGSSSGLTPTPVSTPQTVDHLAQEEDASSWYRITKSAGLITVRAAPEAHRQIEGYLEHVQESAHRQIFVEARIVAIIRDKTSDRGGDFSYKTDFGDSILGNIGFSAVNQLTSSGAQGGIANVTSSKNSDLGLVMQALSVLGDVYTISSPTLLARNNQLSRVSLTKQLGYAETEVNTNDTNSGDVFISSRKDEYRFKNSGTVMSVMPFIGRNKVQMRMRLSVATQSGETAIRTAIGTADPVVNNVPELQNNVIDQDFVLEYGRVYAIGGLIETSTSLESTYMPGLRQIPGLAEVFQRANNRKQDTEFIVFLRLSRG